MSGNLRARLERLRRSGELGAGSGTSAGKTPAGPEFLFPGQERLEHTESGPCYLREQRFPLGSSHGRSLLAEVMQCRGADLALPARDASLHEIRPGQSLFLDIETTGLSGGTGTWAFLIGLGWFEDDAFRLRQYFLRHPAEEKAMLEQFTACAARFTSMVTFNGKVFDLPLIQTRQVLARLQARTEPRYHIDLLPCSRNLWKERLSSCSLRSLEEALLGLKRHDDIPGWEIPAVYFDYLRRGSTVRLRQVFEHNVLDILSMAALLARVARTAAGEELEHPADSYSLGRLHAGAGQVNTAVEYYRRVLCCGDQRLEGEAALRLSFIHKRRGEWDEASTLWRELIGRRCFDLTPYIELAKYCEHRANDPAAALELAAQALSRAHARQGGGPATGELSLPALHHRITRLQRKLNTL